MNLREQMEALGSDPRTIINNLYKAGCQFDRPTLEEEKKGCIMQQWLKNMGLSQSSRHFVYATVAHAHPSNRAALEGVVAFNDALLEWRGK